MSITIYSFAEFQKLAREGSLPLNAPVLTNATGSLNGVTGSFAGSLSSVTGSLNGVTGSLNGVTGSLNSPTITGNLRINSAGVPSGLDGGIAMLNGTINNAALANGVTAVAQDDGAGKSEWVFVSEGLTKYHLGGSADEDVRMGGMIDSQFTAVGNVGAGEDEFLSYTLPANALDVDGKAIRVTAFGFGNGTDNVTLKFYFGSTILTLNSGSSVLSWFVTLIILRTAATVQLVKAHFAQSTLSAVKVTNGSETLSAAVAIKFTGENTSDVSNDAVVQQGMIIELLN